MHTLNKVFPKIFVLNLPRCADRMAYMERQLENVEHEFVTGIDGMSINVDQLEKDGIIDKAKLCASLKREPFPGEVGCVLSHQLVYRRVLNENISHALILEDDVAMNFQPIERSLEEAFNELPPQWDMLYLGYQYNSRLRYSKCLKRAQLHDGAFAYAVSLSGASKLLTRNTPVTANADANMIRCCRSESFSAFLIDPPMVEFTNLFRSSVWF